MSIAKKTKASFRLYPRETVKIGNWYYTFICKGCGKLIYPLEDGTNGERPAPMLGFAEFLIPCPRCLHDDAYLIQEAKVVQSTESLDGFRPARVEVSKSSRKPLIPQFKNAKVIMGVGLIEDRPKAAAIIGRIATAWSDVEVACARLLAELMGTNAPAAAAVFGALRSSRTQSDALDAAAKVVLNTKDHMLFAAHMARKASLEKERNDLVHGCYGVAVSLPDAVIWVSQSDYIAFRTARKNASDDGDLEKYWKRMFVYELGTLERIAQEISEFHAQLGFFIGYLGISDDNGRAQRFDQLCNQSHISQALDRLQTAQKEL